MSRLRARTWTPVERECMEWYLHWSTPPDGIEGTRNAVGDWNMGCAARTSTVQAMAVFQVIDAAERIMRTKGIDLYYARIRARGYFETHIDPVTGRTLIDLLETEFARDYVRDRSRSARYAAWGRRAELSRYANRKYPLKRPAPVSRVIVHSPDVEAWFILGWVPSDSNPNIYVRREA